MVYRTRKAEVGLSSETDSLLAGVWPVIPQIENV